VLLVALELELVVVAAEPDKPSPQPLNVAPRSVARRKKTARTSAWNAMVTCFLYRASDRGLQATEMAATFTESATRHLR
jgi:hypothetical protein